MIVLGWLNTFIGAALGIIGIVLYNEADSAGYGLYRHFDSSNLDAARIIIILGVLFLVFGILFLIIGYTKNSSDEHKNDSPKDLLNTKRCLNCGYVVMVNENFCPRCGNDLVNQKKKKT